MNSETIDFIKPPTIETKTVPWRITFDTNPDDCNLSCIMCEEFSEFSNLKELYVEQGLPRKRRMPFETIEKILFEVSKQSGLIEIIPSTMGEPLFYKEFPKILELCKKYNIKLNLTTNGTFPKRKEIPTVRDWAKLIVPVTSDIKISWNGTTKETQEKIMKKSVFEDQLRHLIDFIAIRDEIFSQGGNFCRVTLQVTFLETKYQEFPDLVVMASKYGVDRIKGHHLWAHFNEIKELSMRRNADSINRWNTIVDQMYENRDKFLLPNGKKIILENIYRLDPHSSNAILQPDWVCPFLGQEAWIAWDGRFNPCCAPDAQRRQLGYFGNIKETSLLDIWNSEKYLDLVKNYWNHPLCQSCNMRRPKEDLPNGI